jgi:hypothetical protein
LTDEPSLTAEPQGPEQQQDNVREAFNRLYADGRAYAGAEIERQKLRAAIAGAGVRDAAIFATAGFLLAFAGLIAFLVGLVLLLTPHLGAGWSAVAIFGSSLLAAIILFLLAKGRISQMRKAIKS